MKIANFTDTYKPQINGVITSIDTFAKELRKEHEVHIFAPRDPDYKKKLRNVHFYKSIPFRFYPGYRIGTPVKLLARNIIKNNGFDIIHVHTPVVMGAVGMAAAKRYKIPLVGTYHTLFTEYMHYFTKREKIKNFSKKLVWQYTKHFYNRCDHIIAPSEKIKSLLEDHDIIKPITVIPTGTETQLFKGSKRKLKKKYNLKGKVILHVGRLTKEKNIDAILEATKDIDATLVITSDGPYRERAEKRAHSNVVFTGYLSQKDLENYYKLADVFVMGSQTETQGIVLLEALRGDNPLVVLEAPVTADFVRENKVGYVAEKGELKNKIEKALEKDIFRQARKRALEKYSIEKCTSKLLDVYEKTSP